MQDRQEIVGYRSSFNQILAHFQTGIPVAIISLNACRRVFGWFNDPSLDNTFRAFGVTAACALIMHIINNYGAEQLAKLQRDARELEAVERNMLNEGDALPRLPKMCLFSSVETVYRHHRDTILGSALAAIVLSKSLEILMNEGFSKLNIPFFLATISLLMLELNDFASLTEENFGAIMVDADRVLTM
jgi:hypothetical protein